MRIKKYDFDYSRRAFLEKTSSGGVSGGLLASLWPSISESADTKQAYPDELLDIETFTRGQVKVGDTINKDNVFLVQDLLDPITFQQVMQDGRTFHIQASEHSAETMFPPYFQPMYQ